MTTESPPVEVTDADRRARRWLMHHIQTVDEVDPAEMVEFAIARARTMGAFEERCRAVGFAIQKTGIGAADLVELVGEGALDMCFELVENAEEGDDVSDDDIRRLVLQGWATWEQHLEWCEREIARLRIVSRSETVRQRIAVLRSEAARCREEIIKQKGRER